MPDDDAELVRRILARKADPNKCPVPGCGYTHPVATMVRDHQRKEH